MPKPQQKELFSQRELAQFGVTARPQISLSPSSKLELQLQDPRTKEQKEEDEQQNGKARTLSMFADTDVGPSPEVVRRDEILKQAAESCRQLLGTLEMLQKVRGNIDHFVPALVEQAVRVEQAVGQLNGSKNDESSAQLRSDHRLGPRSSYTVILVEGFRVIYPF